MTALLDAVRRHAKVHADESGIGRTPVPGLTTVRATAPSGLAYAVSRPLVCLVVQGAKHVTMGAQDFMFSAGDSLLITADMPMTSQITRASESAPYLAVVLELDVGLVAELAAQMGAVGVAAPVPARIDRTEMEVADTALRLMLLLDRPAAVPVLGAQLVREMHYWLLTGRHGTTIQQLGWSTTPLGRVARAIAMLRTDFARPLRVECLAEVSGMSLSSFYHHFRVATSLSPLQFQKQLRLIEARRLMTEDHMPASRAAFAVGYESVPQFTREYGRMFGLPPRRHVREARCGEPGPLGRLFR
ncbi:AraC family transcriptional regulator N-terminal domain-containing protein [Methylobacterium aquaticum]|uniref:AraC family transcriptional regulator n=1 Tax=Methylobacterium aquaticum TaxID=270351 RepID=UPI003D1722A2